MISEKITQIVVEDYQVVVYKKEVRSLNIIKIGESQQFKEAQEFFGKMGYEYLFHTFHGYGYISIDGEYWLPVDLQNCKAESYKGRLDRKQLVNIVQSWVVPEEEWGPEAQKIPVKVSSKYFKKLERN